VTDGHPAASRGVLSVSALVLSGSVVTWAIQGDQTGCVASFLVLFGLAFMAYLAALHASVGSSGRGLRAALSLAVAWRLVLAFGPPLLSNDVNRYVWEGRVQVHGGNPYAWSDRPNAPKWDGLRDSVYEGMNHKEYTAAYPPLWQMAAAVVVWVHDSLPAMKLFLVACELAALFVLSRVLRHRGLPAQRLLVWAWNPLAIVEIAGSGHNEALGLLFLALALLALDSKRPLAAALFSALGFQAKFLPGLLAVSWWRRFRPWHVAAAALLAGILVWPYWGARKTLLLSLGKYAEFWRFNESLFAPLAAIFGHAGAVRAGVFFTLLLAALLGLRRAEPMRAGLLVTGAALLLGPNLLPWYALWLLPFLVLVEAPAALLFTGTVALAYLVYPGWQSGERWYLPWSVRALEYLPCLAVLVLTPLKTAQKTVDPAGLRS
jgi:alpha-1,6-mannosyltransferase